MDATQMFLRSDAPVPQIDDRRVPAKSWRPPAGVRLISADDHFRECELLWQEHMPSKWKDRAPKNYFVPGEGWRLEIGGRNVLPGGLERLSERGMPSEGDPVARLAAMDEEGIEAAVLFPQWAGALNGLEDLDLFVAATDTYNEWIAGFLRPHARRLLPVASLAAWRKPEIARDELQKVRQLGFKAVQLPSSPRDVRYNSREMDGLFSAIEESGLPLSFHIGPVTEFTGTGSLGANLTRNLGPYRPLLGQLIFSGVLERHPALRVVFTEGGASWAAQCLSDMDFIYRTYHDQLRPRLGAKPSSYWHRQCATTFMFDPAALRVMDILGADNVLWSLDFPHTESVWGFAGEVAEDIWNRLGPIDGAKVLGGNAARIWGIESPN